MRSILFLILFSFYLTSVASDLFRGNIDSDGDGISDKKDACPDEPGPKSNQGCPEGIAPPPLAFRMDRDRDGIENLMDACPDVAGSLELNGCPIEPTIHLHLKEIYDKPIPTQLILTRPTPPKTFDLPIEPSAKHPIRDADHDGVKNFADKCPFSKGDAQHQGCPSLTSADQEVLSALQEDLIFERYKDYMTPQAKSALESFSIMMSIAYPNVSAQFSIYADEWADRESNADLCYGRGKAIMKFLAEKEIPKERIQLEYFANLRPPKSKSWEQNERSRIEVMLIFP